MVALLPFADGHAGLQPLPGGGANLCAALHGEPARDAAALLARVSAGLARCPTASGAGAAVCSAFTGSAMALHSGLAAATAILTAQDATGFHADWRRRSAMPMRLAGIGARVLQRWPAGFAAAGPMVARAFARATRLRFSHPATG